MANRLASKQILLPDVAARQKPPSLAELQAMMRKGVTANELSDAQLIGLLRQKPKKLPYLRTADEYRNYFTDVDDERLGKLVTAAFLHLEPTERQTMRRCAVLGITISDVEEENGWRAAEEKDTRCTAEEEGVRRTAHDTRRTAEEEDAQESRSESPAARRAARRSAS